MIFTSNMKIPDVLSDVSISKGLTPSELDSVSAQGVLWQIADSRFLLGVPHIARFLVEAGNSVTIDPVPEVSPVIVEHHLGMLPLAALLYQRGLLAIHAATVANEQGAVLISGDSGSGKSTLITALLQHRWRVLADDLSIVGLSEQGVPVVYPTASSISLWPDTCEKMGINSGSLPYVDANRRKFTPTAHSVRSPQPLLGIYHLCLHNNNEVKLEELDKIACFRLLGSTLYNSHVADVLCDRAYYLRCMATIAQSVPIWILRRPRGRWSVDDLADLVAY